MYSVVCDADGAGDGSSLLLEKVISLVLVAFIARELLSHRRLSFTGNSSCDD